VDIKSCVAPAKNLLHKRKPDELFPKQQREELLDDGTEIAKEAEKFGTGYDAI